MDSKSPLKRTKVVFPSFNDFAKHNDLSVKEYMIMSALFKVYSPEELCFLFDIEWPLK